MEFDLRPMTDQIFSESDGGVYYNWSSSQFPVLSRANVAAGRLVLRPHGFALPHYADSPKVGYVIQGGNGVVGLVIPNESKEQVLKLSKGDAIPIPTGVVSWWFNDGDSDLEIIFLSETSNSHIHGEITYFLLAGAQGILSSFSPEFISKAYNINKQEANKLTHSQPGILIIKLQPNNSLPEPQCNYSTKMVFNFADIAEANHEAACGALITSLDESKFPFIGQTGLSASLEKLCPNAIRSPIYTADSSVQVIYVVSGSGRVEIVGFNAMKMAAEVKAGHLLVVPKYFVVGKEAGEDGMECLSILTTTRAVIEELAGKGSVWEALSEEVLKVSFNVSAEFEKMFISKAANY